MKGSSSVGCVLLWETGRVIRQWPGVGSAQPGHFGGWTRKKALLSREFLTIGPWSWANPKPTVPKSSVCSSRVNSTP